MLVLDEATAESARASDATSMLARENAVFSRWQRARALGARPHGAAYPIVESGSALDQRRERLADVFREEGALLAPIAGQLAARALVAIVADPDGVILSTHGGGTFIDPAARVRLVCGAMWSEAARGTNAIGTAIAESRAVAVLGRAHFEERNHGLFCYATPVRDAYGDVIAVLDVTGPMGAHDPAVGVAVQAAGAGLERALRAISYAQAGTSVLRTIERLVMAHSSPAFVVDADGAVRIVNAAALSELSVSRGASLTCERIFGVSYTGLLQLALDGQRPRFETRAGQGMATGNVFDVELDPLFGAEGRALAVTVHLTARSHGKTALDARVTGASDRPVPASATSAAAKTPSTNASSPESQRATSSAPLHPAFAEIASSCPRVDGAKSDAARFAATRLPVLLLAETGTGKELFARAIHAASANAAGPFVPVNCGAFTKALLESELFGYAPGAFTGAARGGAEGKLAVANGGTLFLDEVAEMPESLQAALLRVLEDGTYTPVGGARTRTVSFRLVCATCRDLPALVAEGAFRQDLFYRIYGACVTIPPLRERDDRVWLAATLLERVAPEKRLAQSAVEWIATHDWPGNVRELSSAIAHAVALAGDRDDVVHGDFPASLFGRVPSPNSSSASSASGAAPSSKKQLVRDAFQQTLEACQGNVTRAASMLGVARSTLYRSKVPRGGR